MRTMLSMAGPPAVREPSPDVRVPPRVIRVPPPKVAVVPFLALPWGLWAGLTVLIGPAAVPGWAIPLWYGGFVAAVVAGIGGEYRYRVRLNRRRHEWLQRHPNWGTDCLAERFDRLWFFLNRPPRPKTIRETLEEASAGKAQAAVVCLGAFEVPERGDYRFEPSILTTGQVERIEYLLVAAFVFLAAISVGAGLEALGWLPGRYSEYWCIVAFAAAGMAYMFWRYALRPTYVRVAPGVVDVLTYSILQAGPRVRRYAVTPELLCIVAQGWARVSVTLVSGAQRDEFQIAARRSEQFIDTLLRALVSTAPTPPLSREELVG